MKKNALISVLAVAASFPTVAKGFVLHLEHGFDANNPVVIVGGTQPFPTNAEEFDVSAPRGVILTKVLSYQQRYIMRLVNRGSASVALRLDVKDASSVKTLPGTQPINLVLDAGETRELAMEAWTPMTVVVSAAAQ